MMTFYNVVWTMLVIRVKMQKWANMTVTELSANVLISE